MNDFKPIDGVFKLDTNDALKGEVKTVIEDIPTFKLVGEDDPILYQTLPLFDFTNPPVDPNKFASSLVETCKKAQGVGLSANQCGFNYRVFVMGANDDFVAFFNPKVLTTEGEVHMMEGCLSFPLLGLHITRPKKITVEYQDFQGEVKNMTLDGISARVFLHELDHMNGIVYTQHAKPLALKSGMTKRQKMMKKMAKTYAMLLKSGKIQNGTNAYRTS
jgi:peptide deformylase